MKWIVCFCLFVLSICGLEPPQPIQGVPNVLSQSFVLVAGNTEYVFTFPEEWGMGDASAVESEGNFILFPIQGGYGCSVKVSQFESEQIAKEGMERLKKGFVKMSPLSDGFEAVIGNAKYACYVMDRYVSEIWYSLPKRKIFNTNVWQQLKHCLSVSSLGKVTSSDEEWVAVKEIPFKGWICNHPNNQLHVLLESRLGRVIPSQNRDQPYLLQIKDWQSSGYFYIQWDQKNLDCFDSYKAHLNEMKAHILSLGEGQKFEKDPSFVKEDQIAVLRGKPYTLVSLSGDEFLFGFALKNTIFGDFRSADFDSYVKQVKWWRD